MPLTKQEKGFKAIAYAFMCALAVAALAPFVLLISGSLTDNAAAVRDGYKFFPSEFSLEAYRYIFIHWDLIGKAYGITALTTAVGTLAALLLVSTLGFALSQRVPGRKVLLFMVVFTMLFNGGIVSSFMIYSNVIKIKNSILALIVPNLLLNGFTVVLVRSYFLQNIPPELLEAAEMDGAGQLRVYWKIAMPLATPILATIGLLTAVAYWNDWVNGLYYITDPNLYTIQLLLNRINNNIQFLATKPGVVIGAGAPLPSVTVRMAIAAVAVVPIIVIYPFFQKYFAKGITLGGVKG